MLTHCETKPGIASVPHQKALIQPKLEVNAPGDRYEREADAMAERVMSSSGKARVSGASGASGVSVQRKCAECEEEEKKKGTLMRKAEGGGGGFDASPALVSRLGQMQGGGVPLPGETKRFMEGAFSADFSGVRIHADDTAAEMNRGVHAKAFTYGRDIYFNRGQFNPGSTEGRTLLAHELTHVTQQAPDLASRSIQRKGQHETNPCTRTILAEGSCQDLVRGSAWICCDPDNGFERKGKTTSKAEPGKQCPSQKWSPTFTCDNTCTKALEKGCDDSDNWMAIPHSQFSLGHCGDEYTICAGGQQTKGYVRDSSVTQSSYEVSPGILNALGQAQGSSFLGSVYRPGAKQTTIDADACCNKPAAPAAPPAPSKEIINK